MSSKEPYIIAALSILTTYIIMSVLGNLYDGEITLGTLVWTSFLLANIATYSRACARPEVPSSPMAHNVPNGGPLTPGMGMGLGMSTPERKLKFKASGDEKDWFAASNNSIKV